MASPTEAAMGEPICLIENTSGNGLVFKHDALEILRKIQSTLVVVAIVGPYRSGKSFLMNRLLGQNCGFSIGSTIQSETKGIWMWCIRHPTKSDSTLVLLDTEGLGDVEKGDDSNDNWIFSLAILLCSTFVYNNLAVLNNNAIEKLHNVIKLSALIKSRPPEGREENSPEDDPEDSPNLVWALRDFTLELVIDGKQVTADEYIRHSFKLKRNSKDTVSVDANNQRECITDFFADIKCFVFPRAAPTQKLQNLEELGDSDLDPDFLSEARTFCDYIFRESKPKRLQGKCVNGETFAQLVKIFVETINSGKVPHMQDALTTLAATENTKAVEEGMTEFMKIYSLVTLPTETADQLFAVYVQCAIDALGVFHSRAYNDKNKRFRGQLEAQMSEIYSDLWHINLHESKMECEKVLARVVQSIKRKTEVEAYIKAGGHQEYINDKMGAINSYLTQTQRQLKSKDVLDNYINDSEAEAENLFIADLKIQQKEDETAEQTREFKINSKRALDARQKAAESDASAEDLKKLHEQQIREIEHLWEMEKERVIKDLEAKREEMLREQKLSLEKGNAREVQKRKQEIRQLEEQIGQTKRGNLKQGLKMVGVAGLSVISAATAVVGGPVVAVIGGVVQGLGMKLLSLF